LGVRFELNEKLEIYTPAGDLFLSPLAISQKAEAAQLESVHQQARAIVAGEQAEQERQQKEVERDRADLAEQKAALMAAKLRELGLDPDTI
jgi:hypothetical protein